MKTNLKEIITQWNHLDEKIAIQREVVFDNLSSDTIKLGDMLMAFEKELREMLGKEKPQSAVTRTKWFLIKELLGE